MTDLRVVSDDEAQDEETPAAVSKQRSTHPIFGALKDVTWIAPDVDLTKPADPEWADRVEDRDWGRLPK